MLRKCAYRRCPLLGLRPHLCRELLTKVGVDQQTQLETGASTAEHAKYAKRNSFHHAASAYSAYSAVRNFPISPAGVHDPLDFDFRMMAEIDQQAQLKTGGPQIILHLGAVFIGSSFTAFSSRTISS